MIKYVHVLFQSLTSSLNECIRVAERFSGPLEELPGEGIWHYSARFDLDLQLRSEVVPLLKEVSRIEAEISTLC